ncbi:unnamed protein product [Boreogadus saida]
MIRAPEREETRLSEESKSCEDRARWVRRSQRVAPEERLDVPEDETRALSRGPDEAKSQRHGGGAVGDVIRPLRLPVVAEIVSVTQDR